MQKLSLISLPRSLALSLGYAVPQAAGELEQEEFAQDERLLAWNTSAGAMQFCRHSDVFQAEKKHQKEHLHISSCLL